MNTWFTVALVLPLMILGCKSEDASDSAQQASDSAQQASDSAQQASRSGQLVRLECSHWGRFTEKCPWNLTLDADGRAKLTIDCGWPNVTSMKNDFKNIERTFMVEQDRIADIEAAIDKYRFFELPAQVGRDVPDAGIRVLSIWTTNGQKTLTINFFGGIISLEDFSVRMETFNEDARCALKLWAVVRDCFSDEEAADARPHDKWLLQQEFPGKLKQDEIEKLNELLDYLHRGESLNRDGTEKGPEKR